MDTEDELRDEPTTDSRQTEPADGKKIETKRSTAWRARQKMRRLMRMYRFRVQVGR